MQVTNEGIRFKRQLVGAQTCKAITISNKGLLPAAWKLVGKLPAPVTLSSTEGVIAPGKTSKVVITLYSKEAEQISSQLSLEVSNRLNQGCAYSLISPMQ